MKNRIRFTILSLFVLAGTSHSAVVNFTPAEGYAAGAQLNTHPDWVAQTQWTSETGGDGVARENSGAYIRANYQAVAASNDVGDSFTVEATFTMQGSYSAPSMNLQSYQEPIFVLNVTEVSTATPAGRMGVALALEDDSDPDELHLRFLDAASGSTNLGAAALYDGHTFKLTVHYTKLDATTYSATATLDSLNDASGAFEITDALITPNSALSSAASVFGIMQSVVASADPYSGVEVDQFKFEFMVEGPNIIPSTPVLLPDVVLVEALQFKVEHPTRLQVKTNLTDNSWQNVEGSEISGSEVHARFIDTAGGAGSERFYRVSKAGPIFSDDFESAGEGGWTVSTFDLTNWEKGAPNLVSSFVTLTNAASGSQCWGTDLDSEYSFGADTTLTSPVVVLPATGPLTLQWNEWVDMDFLNSSEDKGFVSIMDLDAGTNILIHTTSGSTPSWNPVSIAIPDSALGHSIQIKFQFVEDTNYNSSWGGWYIDDVIIPE